ncbi:MAG: LytTR family DNA-binding domain-containing protein [Clostridia bacterium]
MIKIGMCDDNLESIKTIAKCLESEIIEQDMDAEIVTITTSQKEIFDAIYKKELDILILDVDFKDKGENGVDFGKKLRNINKEFYLIFLSAHQRYMHTSLIAKVFDYLVKPINKETLQLLVSRLKDEFANDKSIFLHLNKWVSIRTKDIIYIEKDGNKCQVVTNELKSTTTKTLDALLKELPKNFMKCHRSYIVNEDKILSIDTKDHYVYFHKDLKCPINSHFSL